jgi:hypothetical protein
VVIREKTRAAQEIGCPACGDAWVAAGRAEPAAAAVAGTPDVAALPEVESHPEQARTSERTPPSRAPATWCLTMPPISCGNVADPERYHQAEPEQDSRQ